MSDDNLPERIWIDNCRMTPKGRVGVWGETPHKNGSTEYVRALPDTDAREAALREAAAMCRRMSEGLTHYGPEPYYICEASILALIGGART